RTPCLSPCETLSGNPSPTVIREIGPASIMISGPAEILVRDPCPSVIGVSPVAVGIGPPILVVYRDVGLPAVSVSFNLNPVSAGKIIVKDLKRYILSPRLLKSRRAKSNHC